MIKDAVLSTFAIILIIMCVHRSISIAFAICMFIIVFIFCNTDILYSAWILKQEQNKFETRMGKIINKINANEMPVIEPIPKIIIQIWVQKDGGPTKVPIREANYMNAMIKMNPTFQYLFFNGDDIEQFFKSNYVEYYKTYKTLPFFIQKLDFFRYLAIYHYGGFYFDMDVELHKPLDENITNHSAIFPIDEYANSLDCQKPRMSSYCSLGQNFLLGQYAFGATSKHPFMKLLVDRIHRKIDKYIQIASQIDEKNKNDVHYFVYKTTGPDFVTECYLKYENKNQLYILSNGKRQVFGDYATHKYVGYWK